MTLNLRLSAEVLAELIRALSKPAAMETEVGRLFLAKFGLAAIVLKVEKDRYLNFLSVVAEEKQPTDMDIIPTSRNDFQFVILKPTTVGDGKVFIESREVVLL